MPPAEEKMNFWPMLKPPVSPSGPVAILRQLAKEVDGATSNLVTASIESSVLHNEVVASLVLVAKHVPAIRYELLRLRFPLDKTYPLVKARIHGENLDDSKDRWINTEEDLRAFLKELLADKKTVGVLTNLMNQSYAAVH